MLNLRMRLNVRIVLESSFMIVILRDILVDVILNVLGLFLNILIVMLFICLFFFIWNIVEFFSRKMVIEIVVYRVIIRSYI